MDSSPEVNVFRLLELPHADARRLTATGAPVYMAVDPLQYHGPHLPLNTGRLLSRALAARIHAQLVTTQLVSNQAAWPLLFGADVEAGADPCPGPGTRYLPRATVRQLLEAACRALVDLGAKRVILLSSHTAPAHNLLLHEAVQSLRSRGVQAAAPLALVREALQADPRDLRLALQHLPDADQAEVVQALGRDFHAGLVETSLALHLVPQQVAPGYRSLPPCPPALPAMPLQMACLAASALGVRNFARDLATAGEAAGWRQIKPFPGYTGRPDRASREIGQLLEEQLTARSAALLREVFAGRREPPAPVLSWRTTASLQAFPAVDRWAGMPLPPVPGG